MGFYHEMVSLYVVKLVANSFILNSVYASRYQQVNENLKQEIASSLIQRRLDEFVPKSQWLAR